MLSDFYEPLARLWKNSRVQWNAYNNPLLAATVSPFSVGASTVMKAVAVAETCVVRTDDEEKLFFIPEGCAGAGESAAPATDG